MAAEARTTNFNELLAAGRNGKRQKFCARRRQICIYSGLMPVSLKMRAHFS